MPDYFAEKTVLITGASSGIGRALAIRLAKLGARIGLVARRRELLEELAKSVGGTSCIATADVSKRVEIHTATKTIRNELGSIDLLIANAGVGTPTLLDPLNVRDVERMFEVNVLGVIYAIEAVLPEMLQRKSGHIVAVSSLGAYKGLPGESGYCATKAAINLYLEGLRIQLRGHGISVTTLCPGFVETPMTAINDFKMPFLLSADQAAERMLWAIRRKKKIHCFPRRMSWLMRLIGWMPDWLLARAMNSYNSKPPMNEIS